MIQILLRVSLIIVVLGITYLSVNSTATVSVGSDKIGHFIAYATLMINLGLMYHEKKKDVFFAALFAFFYGVLMEVVQGFIPGRVMSIYDIVANTIGVAIGLVVTLLFASAVMKMFSK